MALEAVQAQAGHASINTTQIYLHLADDWLTGQYRKAAEVIDAQSSPMTPQAGDEHPTKSQRPPRRGTTPLPRYRHGTTSPRALSSSIPRCATSTRSPACCDPAR